jgi:hypothetical protein
MALQKDVGDFHLEIHEQPYIFLNFRFFDVFILSLVTFEFFFSIYRNSLIFFVVSIFNFTVIQGTIFEFL